mgnify:CR=1 FL=1
MKMNQLNKHYGVDVSEHNGIVNWQEVRDAGIEFAIIRLGYGRGHLDSQFYHNVNGALNAGISIGVYYYSYAQNCNDAIEEAAFATHILNDCGLVPARLTMGLWYDAEEAPYWDTQQITNRCSAFINTAWQAATPMPGCTPILIGGPITSTVPSSCALNGAPSIIAAAIYHRLTCGNIPIH